MKTVFIYALTCPITGSIRYIGKTQNLERRYKLHFTQYALSKSTKKAAWLRDLLKKNLRPKIVVIAEVDSEKWQEWERFYISHYREKGCHLVNLRDGGIGGITDEERARLSSLRTGSKLSPGHIEAIRKANTGRVNSREAIEKTAAAKRGKKRSPETIEKIRQTFANKSPEEKALQLSHLRAPKSDSTRAKMSASATGRVMSPERKAKIAESVRKRWAIIKASR